MLEEGAGSLSYYQRRLYNWCGYTADVSMKSASATSVVPVMKVILGTERFCTSVVILNESELR